MSGAALSRAWSTVARARVALYRRGWLARHPLERPTVSVGALEMGGSGKSPAVAALARLALEEGLRPGILSRGYRRRSRGPVLVCAGSGLSCDARDAGDEPAMYALELPQVPVAVAARREEAAATLLDAADVDLFLLDDAFQHLRVARDLDLLMVDADRPFWKAAPPPGGRLREGAAGAERAHGFLLVGDRNGRCRAELERRFPGRDVFDLHGVRPGAVPRTGDVEAGASPPQPTLPFAGIARPERLLSDLLAAGVEALPLERFADHHWYQQTDLDRLAASARRQGAASMTTTAKDAVRLPAEIPGPELWIWRYRLVPEQSTALRQRLRALVGGEE